VATVNDAAVLRNVLVARTDSGVLETRNFVLSRHGGGTGTYTAELTDHVVLPALVNAHDHLHLNGIPPLQANESFGNSYAWASTYQTHFEQPGVKQALEVPSEIRHWQGALKNALSGATTVMHHDPPLPVFDQPGFPTRTVHPYGWAHSLHWQYGPPVAHSFASTPADVGWFIHLAEGTDDVATAELRELEALGCLQANTVLIHGVGLDDDDIERIIARGASLVWCPASNLHIIGKTVEPKRLRRLFAAGHLTLGTDSRLSGARDLLDELRIAASCSDFSARELLQLTTVMARRLLRTAPTRDDVIIFRRRSADPFADLLGVSRHELRAVVRDGEPLIVDPDLEDWFVTRGIAYMPVLLDGHPKLCARAMLPPGQTCCELEPGLTADRI
jgi:hypothetical protein